MTFLCVILDIFTKVAKILYDEKIVSKETAQIFKGNQNKEKELKGLKTAMFNLTFVWVFFFTSLTSFLDHAQFFFLSVVE